MLLSCGSHSIDGADMMSIRELAGLAKSLQ